MVYFNFQMHKAYVFPLSEFSKADQLLEKSLSYKSMLNSFDFFEKQIYLGKGRIDLYQGKFNDALEQFTKATEMDMRLSDHMFWYENKQLAKSYYFFHH